MTSALLDCSLFHLLGRKGFMKKLLVSALITCGLSACSYDNSGTSRSPEKAGRTMPDIFQSVSPSQQRAIMSGERPDWTEIQPTHFPRRM